MSQQSIASQGTATSDIALARNIDVLGQKLARLESRLATANKESVNASPTGGERDLKRVLDHFSEPVVVHVGGNIVYANASALHRCGAEVVRKLLGQSYLSLIHPDYRSVVKVRMATLRNCPDREDSANVIALRLDGAEYPTSIRMMSVTWRGDAAVMSLHHGRPENGQSEEDGASFSDPVDLDDRVWLWQADTGAVHVGPGLGGLLGGGDAGAMTGFAGWDALIHDDDLPAFRDALRACAEDGATGLDVEVRLKSEGGALRWVRLTGRGLRDGAGTLDRVMGVAEDISPLKRLETQLATTERNLNKSRRVLASRMAALAAREEELDQARRLVDSCNGELAAREEELAETRHLLKLRTSELALRHAELAETRQMNEDLGAALQQSDARLQAKSTEAAELEREVSHARERLAARDRDAAARDKEIDELRQRLASREADLAERQAELVDVGSRLASRESELSARENDLMRFREALQSRTAGFASMKKEFAEAKDSLEARRLELAERDEALRRSVEALENARADLTAREGDLKDARLALADRISELAAREGELAEARARLDDTAARLDAAEADKSRLEQALDGQAACLVERDEALKDAAALLEARAAELAARDGKLAEVGKELTAREAALAARTEELAETGARLADARELAERHACALASHKEALESLRLSIDAKSREFAEREDEFARMRRALKASADRLADQEQALAQSRATLKARTGELAARNEELNQARKRNDAQQAAMRELQAVANHAGHTQNQFLAGVSHELLTPLNAIKGFAEVISHEMFGAFDMPQYRDYAGDIVSSADRLRVMINDLLEQSRVTARKADVRDEILDVTALVREALRKVAPRAEEGGVVLATRVPEDLPRLKADRHMVRQMLLNLLSNAVNFTAEGGAVEAAACVDEDGRLSIAVRNAGPGTSDHALGRPVPVCSGDTPEDVSISKASNGLGLCLVRAQIELHGGRLQTETTRDSGTTVILRFPSDRVAG